jgi:DNA-binding GntR family transcriptional regulator
MSAGSLPTAPEQAECRDERPASLYSEILAGVRDYIVEGRIPDGARVPERELCARFGISRTPLREALKVLASEGLIDLLPNRGARVRVFSAADRRELFDVMGGLEGLAGRLACERATEGEIEAIERLHTEMYGHYLRRDLPAYFRCNQAIHRAIVAAARNAALSATYETFAARAKRIRYVANLDRQRARWGEAMREHEGILDALRRRDGDELADILFRHLRNTQAATEPAEAAADEEP